MWSENVCMLSVCFQLSLTGILVLCFIKRGNRQGYMVSHVSDTGNPKKTYQNKASFSTSKYLDTFFTFDNTLVLFNRSN